MKRLSDFLRELPPKALVVAEESFAETVLEAHRSVKFGSELTGAPGQPVDKGTLRGSWIFEFLTPTHARISSPMGYAEAVEDAVGPHGPVVYGAKNGIGGSHSVKLTLAGLQRIVDVVAARRKQAS